MESEIKINKPRATLRDVAKAAGVSVATVSRVLNDAPHVSDKIKKQVEIAIDDLGFSPSPTARALNTGRTHTVGALIPTLDNAIFAKFLDAVEKRLSLHNHSLVISTTGEDPKSELASAKDLLEMGAEALIVSGEERHSDFEGLIKRRRVPVVITSFFGEKTHYPSIGYDNAAISKIGLDHLWDKGHKKIAVIHGPTEHNDRTRERLAGIRADDRFEHVSYHEVDLSFGGGCQAVTEILTLEERPSAIFGLSDVLALGAMFELARENISIPSDMAVMGFDNLGWSSYSNPPLTSIELSVTEMGNEVADQICMNLNEGKEITGRPLHGKLIERETT